MKRRAEQGLALLLVLSILAVTVPAALEANRRSRQGLSCAAAARDLVRLQAMAESGVQAAMAILVEDRRTSQVDNLRENWADPEFVAATLAALPFGAGDVHLTITDEFGRIQVPALINPPRGREFNPEQQQLWLRFLEAFAARNRFAAQDGPEPTDIVNALKDWMDSGDAEATTGLNGAERHYYRSLTPPYTCANRAPVTVGELALVKGIGHDLLWGTRETPGIAAYLTVMAPVAATDAPTASRGRININTAPREVVAALLPAASAHLAEPLIEYRDARASDADLDNPKWYQAVAGHGETGLPESLVRVTSDCFRIVSRARLDRRRLTVTAIVYREKAAGTERWTCRPVRWWSSPVESTAAVVNATNGAHQAAS
jgi:general secretion pathway protein K